MALDDVITAGVAAKDGCRILTRIKAFVVDEGHCAVLEHIFRDRDGNPLDLTVQEVSESVSINPAQRVVLRLKEILGPAQAASQVYEIEGTIEDGATGTVRAELTEDIVKRAGIYQLSWGYLEADRITRINEGLLSIERSLWGDITESPKHITGPPTINEFRMHIMDSSSSENFLLDDVEFDDAQIVTALIKPIQHFNEVNPPLRVQYTTHNFAWRKHWLDAATGYLLRFAAHNYRRNRLGVNAGGIAIDDQNKEREYMAAAQLLLDEWNDFVKLKKLELNMQECIGIIGSAYD